jgi:hypothetical protein
MALSGDRAKLYDEEAKRKSGITLGENLKEPWERVRASSASNASWLCSRLDASGKILEHVADGQEGGLSALRSSLSDDSLSWCIFSFSPGYPYGEGSRKLAFITCVGKNVSVMKRGKVALQKSGVMNSFEGVATDAGVYQGVAEMTDEAVLAEIQRNMPKATLL